MTSQRQLLLGMFLLIALSVLGFYTLFLSDVKLFGDSTRLVVHFPAAKGLREGDSVQLAGMRIGRVRSLTYDPAAADDRRITVTLLLDNQVELRETYSIVIRDATLLGGRVVAIEPGPQGSAVLDPARFDDLVGTIQGDPFAVLEDVGELFQRNGDRIDSLFEDLSATVAELREGGAASDLNKALDDLARAAENAAQVSDDLRAGKGALGALLTEESTELYDTWLGAGRELENTARAAREGEGLLPRLFNDPELAEEVRRAISRAETAFDGVAEFTTSVREGEGLVPRLINDQELAEKFEKIVDDVGGFTASLSNEEGTLQRLFTSDEIYTSINQISADLAQVSSQLAEGRGTLGRIIMEEGLYTEIELAMKTLNRTLEDLREAAPVSTFTSLLFSAF